MSLDPAKILQWMFCKLFCSHKRVEGSAGWRLQINGQTIAFKGNFMAQVPVGKSVVGTAVYMDAADNPATVEGVPVWASADTAIATVEVDPADPFKARVTAVDLGTVQITATADADLGAGTREVILMGEIEVVAGEAVGGRIDFGAPE